MKKCKKCLIEIKAGRYCPSCYAYLRKHPEGWYDLPAYGVVELATNGDPICHECGAAHQKLGEHICQKHNMDVRDYKEKHGLYFSTQLTNEKYKDKMRGHVKRHYRKAVKKNLLKGGKSTRFKKGQILLKRKRKRVLNETTNS